MQKAASYESAIARKYPEQVVIAIAKDAGGKCNPIALGWTMITSSNPPMLAIAIGIGRYSLEAVRHAREFVVAFPSIEMEREMLYFGTVSGRDEDKLASKARPRSLLLRSTACCSPRRSPISSACWRPS